MATSQTNRPETVLVLGSTGNIGVAAIHGALRSGYNVLAAVRNQSSAQKLLDNIEGDKERITVVEADVISDDGVKGLVDQVRAGKLPSFQHVYATVGGEYTDQALQTSTVDHLRQVMKVNFESNYAAYIATIPYLLEQGDRPTTFTICTGAIGDLGWRALPAMTQGALYSLCNAAIHELRDTDVRFNEVYLAMRVEVDASAEQSGSVKASDFGRVYEQILANSQLKSGRVRVRSVEDIDDLKYEEK